MTTGHVFIATSVDGFIARPDGRLDWLERFNEPEQDTGFNAFMDSVDGLVMGRGSFQTVLGFGAWPYTKPVVVLSRSLTQADLPDHLRDSVRVSSRSPRHLMEELTTEGWRRAYVDGGLVIQSFLRDGLIADMVITTVPVLIGQGKTLFGTIGSDIDLTLTQHRTLSRGMVQSTYVIA
jgi:dihydrofolate reductase